MTAKMQWKDLVGPLVDKDIARHFGRPLEAAKAMGYRGDAMLFCARICQINSAAKFLLRETDADYALQWVDRNKNRMRAHMKTGVMRPQAVVQACWAASSA
jgi:hypothetical protein